MHNCTNRRNECIHLQMTGEQGSERMSVGLAGVGEICSNRVGKAVPS